ncbi:MAG: FeoB-associated Cys-rich membrane protein [Lachnospirales bacterium]
MWATIIISVILVAVVCLIIRGLVRNHKNGKGCGSCPGGCSGCAGGCAYHSAAPREKRM